MRREVIGIGGNKVTVLEGDHSPGTYKEYPLIVNYKGYLMADLGNAVGSGSDSQVQDQEGAVEVPNQIDPGAEGGDDEQDDEGPGDQPDPIGVSNTNPNQKEETLSGS